MHINISNKKKTSRSVSSVQWITHEINATHAKEKNATHAKVKKTGSAKIRSKLDPLWLICFYVAV